MSLHAFLPVVFAAALSVTSCSKPTVRFYKGGDLSQAEKRSLAERIDPYFALFWRPHYSAQWNSDGIRRHVCLGRNDISSLIEHYQVCVFDEKGQLLQANCLEVWSGNEGPETLSAVSPLSVQFLLVGGGHARVGVAHSEQEGTRWLRDYARFARESKTLVESMPRNFATTNSIK
jgi:hypothetical protein